MEKLEKFSDRGYFVKENVLVYYTNNMDKSLKWFEDILGWYGRVIDRNENGDGVYGFASDMPQEISQAVPFKGIHMWYGDPIKRTIALINVHDINSLHKYVKQNGWNQISDIYESGASPKTCDITTLDGSILMLFE